MFPMIDSVIFLSFFYRSKDGTKKNVFDALEWLAALCSHVPNKGEQMVRYYGYYSNVSRGNRKKQNQDEWIPCTLESDESSKEHRRNRARLIQKIYEVWTTHLPKVLRTDAWIGGRCFFVDK